MAPAEAQAAPPAGQTGDRSERNAQHAGRGSHRRGGAQGGEGVAPPAAGDEQLPARGKRAAAVAAAAAIAEDAAGIDPALRSGAGKAAAACRNACVKHKRDADSGGGATSDGRSSHAAEKAEVWKEAAMVAELPTIMKVSGA